MVIELEGSMCWLPSRDASKKRLMTMGVCICLQCRARASAPVVPVDAGEDLLRVQ